MDKILQENLHITISTKNYLYAYCKDKNPEVGEDGQELLYLETFNIKQNDNNGQENPKEWFNCTFGR